MPGGDDDLRPFYGRARIIGGLGLLALFGILAVVDALSTAFALDSIQAGLILGTALLLLGVEAGRKLLGG